VHCLSQVRTLKAPTLIVWGTDDVYFPLKWSHWLAENIPGENRVKDLWHLPLENQGHLSLCLTSSNNPATHLLPFSKVSLPVRILRPVLELTARTSITYHDKASNSAAMAAHIAVPQILS
jgi:hypothetical protein